MIGIVIIMLKNITSNQLATISDFCNGVAQASFAALYVGQLTAFPLQIERVMFTIQISLTTLLFLYFALLFKKEEG